MFTLRKSILILKNLSFVAKTIYIEKQAILIEFSFIFSAIQTSIPSNKLSQNKIVSSLH